MNRIASLPLSAVLDHSTPREALKALEIFDAESGLLPQSDRTDLLATIDQIAQAADDLGICTLAEAVRQQTRLLHYLTGVGSATQHKVLPTDAAETLHRHRNLLMSLVLAGVLDYRGDTAEVAAWFPPLRARTSSTTVRAYTSDEIALLRLWCLGLASGSKDNRRAAAVYSLVDAGLRTGETTLVHVDSVLVDGAVGLLEAPGLGNGLAPRVLSLDTFNVHLLDDYARDVAAKDGTRALLTYRPRTNQHTANPAKRYGNALASATGVIDRIRKAVGLAQHDTTNASVWRWRIQETATRLSVDAAAQLAGCAPDKIWNYLTLDQAPTPAPQPELDFSIRG